MASSWLPQTLQIGKVFDGDGAITNLDFHRDGRYLVASTNQSSLQVFDSLSGTEWKKVYVKKHGAGIVKYAHHEHYIIASSERFSHDLRYHCLYDNKYVRYFKGHNAKVQSLSISTDDNFISTSADNTVHIWNMSSSSPIGKIQVPPQYDNVYASYDLSGAIFGIMCQDTRNQTHSLRLYDAREYSRGPFQDIAPKTAMIESAIEKANPGTPPEQLQRWLSTQWSSFEFSSDGHKILVNTKSDMLLVLDSFSVVEPLVITSRKNDSGLQLGACISTDSQYIMTGSDSNQLLGYDLNSGEVRAMLSGHVAPVGCVRCNPRYDVMASGCENTALWIHET